MANVSYQVAADLVETDSDVRDQDSFRIQSFFQLGERSKTGDPEARLDLCVMAAALTGGTYEMASWWVAYIDLQQIHVELRAEHRLRLKKTENQSPLEEHRAMCVAHEAADAEFYSLLDHAIRSWEERISIPDEDV